MTEPEPTNAHLLDAIKDLKPDVQASAGTATIVSTNHATGILLVRTGPT